MERERDYRAHVMVLPFPGQGHMNPMLQFSKRLASKGIKITVATTIPLPPPKTILAQVGSVNVEPIYDDLGEGGLHGPGGLKGFLERFEANYLQNLVDLIKKYESSKYPIKCLVYHSGLPWALDIAKQLGICAAVFFTVSCAAIVGYLKIAQEDSFESAKVLMRGLPDLDALDFPFMVSDLGRFPPFLRHIFGQLSVIDKADWVIFNSFDKLEEEEIKNLSKIYPIKAIGPTLPSIYLDKRVEDDKEYSFNSFKSDGDACMKWLGKKQGGSVVYVSFGSVACLSEEQVEELAWGLKQSKCNFLWVVRASEEKKLSRKFMEETSEKGLVVTWCPQLEVLSHWAVGCFVTHCGWNSTIEGVSLGVPMLAMPQFLDQFSDAKFLEEVWRVGLKPKMDEKGIVRREEIEVCIKEIMEGEKGVEMKRNVKKWKELAKEAMDEGGSSDKHIDDIVGQLVCN